MTTAAATPAGWYRDPSGVERWWDGAAWRQARAASTELQVPRALPTAPVPSAAYPQPTAYAQQPQSMQAPMPSVVVVAPLKESGIAYVLAIFLGSFGAHRFYLNRPGSAIGLLVLWQLGAWTLLIGVGAIFLLAAVIWWIVDLCTMSGMVHEENRRRVALQQQPYGGYRG